jgi:ATP-dependent DNA helicase RecQ
VELRRDPLASASRAKRRKQPIAAEADRDLFDKLRVLRTDLARAQSVPPYVVFSDRTLLEMAAARPADLAAFRAVHGVGDTKLARYGEAFLAVIREHVAEPSVG